jgi:hypothetical protein
MNIGKNVRSMRGMVSQRMTGAILSWLLLLGVGVPLAAAQTSQSPDSAPANTTMAEVAATDQTANPAATSLSILDPALTASVSQTANDVRGMAGGELLVLVAAGVMAAAGAQMARGKTTSSQTARFQGSTSKGTLAPNQPLARPSQIAMTHRGSGQGAQSALVAQLWPITPGDADAAIRTAEVLLPHSRPLTQTELQAGRAIYGDAIDWDKVRIVQGGIVAEILERNGGRAFVPGNFIIAPENFAQAVNGRDVLIHELMHVYQYQRGGLSYAIESIHGQATEGRGFYNYGGPDGLLRALEKGKSFRDFNVEQQAMIIQDYYRLINWLPTTAWGVRFGDPQRRNTYRRIYEVYIEQMRRGEILPTPNPQPGPRPSPPFS